MNTPFSFLPADKIPSWKSREVVWTGLTHGELAYDNQLKKWEWIHDEYAPLYWVYIAWLRYVVWQEKSSWSLILLANGEPVKTQKFDWSLQTIAQIWQRLHLRLQDSQNGQSVHPIQTIDGTMTFIHSRQIDNPTLFWEARVTLWENDWLEIETLAWWLKSSDPYKKEDVTVYLKNGNQSLIPGNQFYEMARIISSRI